MLRKFMTGFVVLAVIFMVTTTVDAGGGDPDYVFSMSPALIEGAPGSSHGAAAILDNFGGEVQGWSYGVCHDTANVSLTDVVTGADTDTAKNGGPVDFDNINLEPGGVTQGVVICFTGCATVAPGTTGFEMLTMTYTIDGTANSQICFCDTLGAPPVSTVAVVGGASIVPVTNCADVEPENPNQLIASSGLAVLGDPASTTLSLNNVTMPGVDAIQMNVTFDDTILGLSGVSPLFAFEFFAVQSGSSGEVVMGGVADMSPPIDNVIPAGSQTDLVELSWSTDAEGASAIAWADGLGNPPQDIIVVTGQTTQQQPTLVDGTMTVVNFNSFVRGDCNNDSTVNIADGIYGINYLFQMGPEPTCDDACDSNDDGGIDASDCIYIFNYRFLDGPAPEAPFPGSDLDPTPGDGLGCDGDADDI